MSRNALAGIFSALLAMSIVMAAISSLIVPKAHGFSGTDLRAPGDFTPLPLPSPPTNIAGNTSARPDISVRILVGQIFAGYGGAVSITAINNDTRALFLLEVLLEWLPSGPSSSIAVNRRISPGDSLDIKALTVGGPPQPGVQEYQLKMRLLQLRNGQWYRMVSGGDGWLSFSEQSIDVMALAAPGDNPVSSNPLRYFSKTNELVDLSSESVAAATSAAMAGTVAEYNMAVACSIFDWLVANIEYAEDPDGGDIWYSPDETLTMMAGDCEDYAMLLAAMVGHAGGTCRVYLTRDHAFAAVYVGNTTGQMDRAAADIRAYYGTPLQVHAFTDEHGYWMVSDPLGSFYMGGLAVGQVPTEDFGGYWDTSFPESGTLYSVDVTGTSPVSSAWLNPLIWVGAMLVFGFLAIGFIISAQAEMAASKETCPICCAEIGVDAYICPGCRMAFHRHCAFGSAQCRACGGPVQFPPPD